MDDDDSAAQEAAYARKNEAERQARIRSGTARIDEIFSGNFTDDAFGNIRTAYTDFAMPEVDRQYDKAVKDLTFALSRAGTLDSSSRAEQEADLARQRDNAVRTVGQTAINQENSARSDVEAARADLIKTLNATGDVDAAVNDALSRSRTATHIPSFSPIGALFTTGAAALSQQAAEERAAAASGGDYKPRYNTGLFSASNVKVAS